LFDVKGGGAKVLRLLLNQARRIKENVEIKRKLQRWDNLRRLGMHIGKGVNLPMSTWIDTSHCFLISIGDNCGFGDLCVILAHDAMPNEYIDSTRIGKVTIHESCHFGVRTVILPGVEIGPMSVVGANSVVINDIPPHSLAAGNPAKVICSLEEYLERHKKSMKELPLFPYKQYDYKYITPEKKQEMLAKLANNDGYIVGGYTAMIEDDECLVRTK
jgi:maltose O-acetyltransferase